MSDHAAVHPWLDDAALYALGALDGDALERFEAHLVDCDTCHGVVAEHAETVADLAYTVPARQPPEGLRERVLREARDGPGMSVVDGSGSATLRGSGVRLRWLAAASVVIAAAAGAGYWLEREAHSEAEAALLAARQELAVSRGDLAARDSALAMLLAPDVRFAALAAPEDTPVLRVFWNESRDVIVVSAFNLPQTPVGRTYQLWGIGDGAPVSLGTFDTDATGSAVELLQVGQPELPEAAAFQVAAITVEPAGGSPQPTENPRFVGEWRTAY